MVLVTPVESAAAEARKRQGWIGTMSLADEDHAMAASAAYYPRCSGIATANLELAEHPPAAAAVAPRGSAERVDASAVGLWRMVP
jgi:hypothetical protein